MHVLLRRVGISRQNAYRVMVRVEPVWLRDEETLQRQPFGLFSTHIVMASSNAEARTAAVELAREAVVAVAGNPADMPAAFEVEESNTLAGVAWHQPRGFSLYPAEQEPAATTFGCPRRLE